MNKQRVVVYKALPDTVVSLLEQHFDLVHVDPAAPDVGTTLANALRDADGAIGASVAIDAAMLEQAPHLIALSTVSVGIDKFSPEDLTRRGIVLTHTPDVLTETTADLVFALIMATARRVVDLADFVRRGEWQRSIGAAQFGTDVHHKTLGIVGFGRIGQAVARRGALGFGMKVCYTSPRPAPEAEASMGATRVELDTLLAESDFVCLQAPLTPATRHMIGAPELAAMKPSAILINGGRGALVDERALIDALQQGTLAGAGLDVFDQEPLSNDSPLLAMPQVVALPHAGSATHETRYAMALDAAQNLISVLVERTPKNVANPDAVPAALTRLNSGHARHATVAPTTTAGS